MINQQLIDFTRESLQKGATKEKIISDLLSSGWTLGDIEECFNSMNTDISLANPSPSYSTLPKEIKQINSGKKIIPIVVILFILAGGTSGYYFRNDLATLPIIKNYIGGNETKIDEITETQNTTQAPIEPKIETVNQPIQNQNTVVNTTLNPIISTPTPSNTVPIVTNKVAAKNGPIDCGTTTIPGSSESDQKSIDCIEEQFKSCSLAIENINILDPNENPFIEGSKTYYKAYREILGYKDNFCLVKFTYLTSQIPEWNNKSMTCNYNNSKSFSDNTVYNSKCIGPLNDIITGGKDNSYSSRSKNAIAEGLCYTLDQPKNFSSIKDLKIGQTIQLASSDFFDGNFNPVTWSIDDQTIVSLSSVSGKSTIMKAIKQGSTQLNISSNPIIKNGSSSSCNSSFSIRVVN